MKIKETIGIDVSKKTLDARIHSNRLHSVFDNSNKDFKKMVAWAHGKSVFAKDQILFIFEHTGLYSHKLSVFLSKHDIPFAMVPGLEIKRSLGMARGKDDRTDAAKIALYGYRLRDEITPYRMPPKTITVLKGLLSLRERLVKQRAGFKASLKEQKRALVKKENKVLLATQEKMIAYLSKQLKEVESEMDKLIQQDQSLEPIYKLVLSIKGVGPQTALFLIIHTNGFTKFRNARKFASYCGIAPFPNASGTSIRGKTKVSHLANKKIKSLLDMCAKSAIQSNPEMIAYYEKRVEMGKNRMSTINIVRNKLLARIFAVVQRGTPYVDTMKYAA